MPGCRDTRPPLQQNLLSPASCFGSKLCDCNLQAHQDRATATLGASRPAPCAARLGTRSGRSAAEPTVTACPAWTAPTTSAVRFQPPANSSPRPSLGLRPQPAAILLSQAGSLCSDRSQSMLFTLQSTVRPVGSRWNCSPSRCMLSGDSLTLNARDAAPRFCAGSTASEDVGYCGGKCCTTECDYDSASGGFKCK